MLGWKYLGLDDRQDSVVNIVGMNLSGDPFFADFVPSRRNMFMSDGY